jgi:hypothetical protein
MSTVKTGQFHYYSNEFDVQQLKKKKNKKNKKNKKQNQRGIIYHWLETYGILCRQQF